jgi:hypothetical protein
MTPAREPRPTPFEAGQEVGRRMLAEHPLPEDLAARLGELIRPARTAAPAATRRRTA